MKQKLQFILLGLLFSIQVFGQVTAPSNLAISNSNSHTITLAWQDNSNNETEFVIERKDFGGFVSIGAVQADIISFQDTDVTPQVTYEYRIKAKNTTEESGYSNTTTHTVEDGIHFFRAEYELADFFGSSQKNHVANLQWENSNPNISRYLIERSVGDDTQFEQVNLYFGQTGGGSEFFVDDDGDGTGVSSLAPRTTYFYRIRGVDDVNSDTTDYSLVQQITTGLYLTKPEIYNISQGEYIEFFDEYLVNIDFLSNFRNGDDSEGVVLEKSIGDENNFLEVITDSSEISPINFEDNVTSGTIYYYRIGVYYRSNGLDTTLYSEIDSIQIDETSQITPPQNLTANYSIGNGVAGEIHNINLQWNDSTKVASDSYLIERSVENESNFEQIFEESATPFPGSIISFTDGTDSGNLLDAGVYYYRVRKVDVNLDTSAYSNIIRAETGVFLKVYDVDSLYLQPNGGTGDNEVRIVYTGLFNEGIGESQEFIIERSGGNQNNYTVIESNSTSAPIGDSNGVTFTDVGLPSENLYFYRFGSTYNANGIDTVVYGEVKSIQYEYTTDTSTSQVVAPSNLVATYDNIDDFGNFGHYVELRWDTNDETEANYQIERSLGNASNFQLLATVPSLGFSINHFDGINAGEELEPGTYFYRVRREDQNTFEYSDYSNVVTVQTTVNLIAFNVDSLSLEGEGTPSERIVLDIDNSTAPDGSYYDTEGFVIEKSINGIGDFIAIHDEDAVIALSLNTYSDFDILNPNTTYHYRIGSYYRSNGIDTVIYGETKSIFYQSTSDTSQVITPQNLTANYSIGNGVAGEVHNVNLVWEDAQKVDSDFYLIESAVNTSSFEQIFVESAVPFTGSTISFTDGNDFDRLLSGGIYHYRVRKVDASLDTSNYSNIVTVRIPPFLNSYDVDSIYFVENSMGDTQIQVEHSGDMSESTGEAMSILIERSKGNESNYMPLFSFDMAGFQMGIPLEFLDTETLEEDTYYYRFGSTYNSTGVDTVVYGESKSIFYQSTDNSAPTNLTAEIELDGTIRLSWQDNSASELFFVIERSVGENPSDFDTVGYAGADEVSFIDLDTMQFNAGETYWYQVKAVTTNGISISENVSISLPDNPIAIVAPSNLEILGVSSSIVSIIWQDNSDNETGFEVERSVGDTLNFMQLAVVNVDIETYQDASVNPETAYYYRVKAINSQTESAYSNQTFVTTPQASNLEIPSNFTAEFLDESGFPQNSLLWDYTDRASINGFLVERSEEGTGFTQIAEVPASNFGYGDTDIQFYAQYSYRVRAFNATDTSEYTETLIVNTPHKIERPNSISAQYDEFFSDHSIQVRWDDFDSYTVSGYVIEVSEGNPDNFEVLMDSVPTFGGTGGDFYDSPAPFDERKLKPFTTYYYRVKGFFSPEQDTTEYSDIASATTGLKLNKQFLSVSSSSNPWDGIYAQLSALPFGSEDDAEGIIYEKSVRNADNFQPIADISLLDSFPDTYYTDANLGNNQIYFYRAGVYYRSNGVDSVVYSDIEEVVVGDTSLLPSPSDFQAIVDITEGVKLSWGDYSDKETSFVLERAEIISFGDTSDYIVLGNLAENTESFVDSEASHFKEYVYRIKATNSAEESDYTFVSIAIFDDLGVEIPNNLVVSAKGNTTLSLNWDYSGAKIDNTVGFRIRRSEANNSNYETIATLQGFLTTNFKDSLLQEGTKYYYTVSAFNAFDTTTSNFVSDTTLVGSYPFGGVVFHDLNEDGIQESGEYGLENQKVVLLPDNCFTFTDANGRFDFATRTGNYTAKVVPVGDWEFSTDSMISIMLPMDTSSTLNFGLYSETQIQEISTSLTSATTRCFWEVPYWLTYKNEGTVSASGEIKFVPDNLLGFISAIPTPTETRGDTLVWNYSDLKPGALKQINLKMQMPGVEALGDTLNSTVTANITENSSIAFSETSETKQTIRCAYDPNDKQVFPIGVQDEKYTLMSETLEYLIRFQNTGNDTAFNVVITDTLASELDLNSFQVLEKSHDLRTVVEPNGAVAFRFENILLADSVVDEPNSHGFVKFRIKPKTGLADARRIENTAFIYFDFNPAIITNTTLNTLVYSLPVERPTALSVAPQSISEISLVWSDNSDNETGFAIERSENDNSNFTQIATVGVNVTQFVDSNLAGNTTYFYRVRPLDNMLFTNLSDAKTNNVEAKFNTTGAICQGDAVSFFDNSIIFDGEISNYEWDFDNDGTIDISGTDKASVENAFSTLGTVTVWLQITDEQGEKSIVLQNIEINEKPTATIAQNVFELTASEGTSYQWYLDGTEIPANEGGTTQTINATELGIYTVEVSNSTGCSTLSEGLKIDQTTAKEKIDISNTLSIFPNPNSGNSVQIEMENGLTGNVEIIILDMLGRKIKTAQSNKTNDAFSYQIDVQNLPKGMYQVVLFVGDNKAIKKLIRQ